MQNHVMHLIGIGLGLGGLLSAGGCEAAKAVLKSARPDPAPTTLGPPKTYVCVRAADPIAIDGRLNDASWRAAPWTSRFVDIEGDVKPRPRHVTRVKMMWDDEYFYIGATMDEPHLWATLREHDEIVFHDNDFEIFIDPDGDRAEYYEIEVNALGTIFDLLLEKTYIDGGPARHEWALAGMRHAVSLDGTLNDPSDVDRGWSVEFALPWSSLAERAHMATPPKPGDVWRVNFSRVQWQLEVKDGAYVKVPDTPEDNWVWSPQGVVNMHVPERWGNVRFESSR
ncbi:MAG: carbohydrate-binding family 9-like protein [Phycisphaerales bacterium]|nr:carbohydrate-binding family 9-like protein [Phycisphaerales bacterium]